MSASLETTELVAPRAWLPMSRRRCWQCMAAMPLLALAWYALSSHALRSEAFAVGPTVLMFALLVAAFTDLYHRKIYNWTTYPTALWALVFAGAVSLGSALGYKTSAIGSVCLTQSLAGMFACGAVTFVAYLLSRGGAGDVKLSIGIGGWLGVEPGLLAVGLAYILAAATIVLVGALSADRRGTLSGLVRKVGSHFFPMVAPPNKSQARELQRAIPLGGFFALATSLVLLREIVG